MIQTSGQSVGDCQLRLLALGSEGRAGNPAEIVRSVADFPAAGPGLLLPA
jgi:hypothetical protein